MEYHRVSYTQQVDLDPEYFQNTSVPRQTETLPFIYHAFAFKNLILGLPWWFAVKNLTANAGDMGSIPGLGGSHMSQSNKAHTPQLLKLVHSRARAPQ